MTVGSVSGYIPYRRSKADVMSAFVRWPGKRKQIGVFVQPRTVGHGYVTQIEDDAPVLEADEAIRGQVMRALLWHKNEVGMGHSVAMHQITDPLR